MVSSAIEVLDPTQQTPEFAEQARQAEQEVQQYHGQLGINYLKFAAKLSEFKANKYYLGLGYPNFDTWADSPALQGIGWRTARNLVRIVDEALPLLEKYDAMKMLPSISTMYDMLPILNDENGEQKFIEALHAIQGLTTRDAKETIKAIRGVSTKADDGPIFQLKYQNRTNSKVYELWVSTPDTYYQVGSGTVMIEEWPKFEALFKGNVKEMQ